MEFYLYKEGLRSVCTEVLVPLLCDGGDVSDETKASIFAQDSKLWGMFEANKLPNYTDKKAYGLSMCLEL